MIVKKIKNCARCGETHHGLDFKVLVRPIDEYTHWIACPTIGQPILMCVLNEEPASFHEAVEEDKSAPDPW
jgi:hypothetical protein